VPARRRFASFARPAAAALTLAVAALCAWSVWQPLRSDQESDRALDLAANNHLDAARRAVQHAHEIDPLSPRPYVIRNAVEDAAGNPAAAQKALEDAVLAFPADPQTWIQLAQYQLNSRNRPADALKIIVGALYLDPQSRAAQTVYFQASAELNGAPSPTAPPAPTGGIPTAPAPPLTPGGP
jgi:tetratricopeptide (TPR) repeat protein